MSDENSIRKLEALVIRSSSIPISGSQKEAGFAKWHSDCRIAVARIFGNESRNLKDFESVNYSPGTYTLDNADAAFKRAQKSGIEQANAKILSYIDEIVNFGLADDSEISDQSVSTISILENICQKFHRVARQLRVRHNSRPTIDVSDEYDVQDLVHGLLKLHFDDVRPEEWSPSYAGAGSRLDFLLKNERIVLEIKKTRNGLRDKQIGEELIIDISRYERHPDCDLLVCFVYDPDGIIGNPTGLANDLEDHSGSLPVRVIVGPTG